MNVWRLIAHHEEPDKAIELMSKQNRIAIGWPDIGDLAQINPSDQSEISSLILNSYPDLGNSHLGGPSLWNLYKNIQEGDFVILNAHSKRVCVFQITGPYIFETEESAIIGYCHQRPAQLTNINPEDLWNRSGSTVSQGQNIRWTLAGCALSDKSDEAIFNEGARYSVLSTVIERNPDARKKCLEHYGYDCAVCGYNFYQKFGALGQDYIHVHHRVDIASTSDEYKVDPILDLIPLCPNCHAMAHQSKPAFPIDELIEIYERQKA